MEYNKEIFDILSSPTKWAEAFLRNPMDSTQPLHLRSYQREVLDVSRDCRRIVLRYGRRMGKTVVLCADTLWWTTCQPMVEMIENGKSKQRPLKVLIATPFETQINMLWETYTSLIGDSPLLNKQIKKVKTSDVHILEFDNGSKIEGHTIGISSSNKGTSLRGLDGNILFIDELDKIPREIIEAVLMPIWTGHPDTIMRVCSTPSGKRELFYEWCFPFCQEVNTYKGLRNIGDIQVGDYVYGERGTREYVSAVYKQPYRGTLYTVKSAVGEFSCTPNHEIKLLNKDFVRAEVAEIGDYICVPVQKYGFQHPPVWNRDDYISEREQKRIDILEYSRSHSKTDTAIKFFKSKQMRRQVLKYSQDEIKYKRMWPFDNRKRTNIEKAQSFLNKPLSEDMYKLLGFYLAEGNVLKDFSKPKYRIYSGIQLTFSEDESEYITECVELIKKIFHKSPKVITNRDDHSTSIILYLSWVSYVFMKLCGEYSDKKQINPCVFGSKYDKWLIINYIKGDGTGSFYSDFSFVSSSKQLSNQLLQLCYRYNRPAGIYLRKGNGVRKDSYQCNSISRFVKFEDGDYYVRISSIKQKEHDDFVYNIETDCTHTYNVSNMCVHNCTKAEELGWFHRHYPSWHPDNDRWISIEQAKERGIPVTESTEFQVKAITQSDTYEREYAAEFGEEFGGVYKHSLLNKSMVKYCRRLPAATTDEFDPGFKQHPGNIYIMGVDWNSYQNGGQIVIVEFCKVPTYVEYYDDDKKQDITIDFTGKYRVFYRCGIKAKNATQRATRRKIIELMGHLSINYLYVDYGAGDTNIEELTLFGKDHPWLDLPNKLRVIDSGAVVEHWDPVLREKVKKRNKTLMVNFSVLCLEEGLLVLPKEEDQKTKLLGQMRGYEIKNISSRGEFTYVGEDHILDAFNLAIYGFQREFGNIMRNHVQFNIVHMQDPRQDMYPIREEQARNVVIVGSSRNIRDPEKPVSKAMKPYWIQTPRIGTRTGGLASSRGTF